MTNEIQIRPLLTRAEMVQVETVQRETWQSSDLELLPLHSLHALQKNGASLIGAFDGDRLVGFVLGVLGTINTPDRVDQIAAARLKLYSVVAGVLPAYQNQGIGYRLKLAQREDALRIGIRLITWTYDPLESVNGRFNIGKLGAIVTRYFRNFHGEMGGINAGIPTDRFEAEWWITTNRVEGRVVKERRSLGLGALLDGGARLVNATSLTEAGLCQPPEQVDIDESATLLLAEIPSNFQQIKQQDKALALRWRTHTRQLFETLFAHKFMVTDMVYEPDQNGRSRSFYLLTHQSA